MTCNLLFLFYGDEMLDQFLNSISNAHDDLCKGNTCWYRGHSDSTYKLLPTILRLNDPYFESTLFYEYKSSVMPLDGLNKSNWDLLLDMQHYGIPTRLLDWTLNLGTALYFALKDNPVSPCIWILDPHELSLKSTDEGMLFDTTGVPDVPSSKPMRNYAVHPIITDTTDLINPFSIKPPYSNSRIAAQRGVFTVHCKSRLPIEELSPDVVSKVEIPLELIEPLKKYLNILGIDEFSLFPDHDGLSRYLRAKIGA